MKLPEFVVSELTSNVRSVCGTSIYITDLNFKIIASTCDKIKDEVLNELEMRANQAENAEKCGQASSASLFIYEYTFGGAPLCFFVTEEASAKFVIRYMKALADILLGAKEQIQSSGSAGTRDMLINQLTNAGRKSSELASLMKDFGYSHSCKRCAVLFEITQKQRQDTQFDFSHFSFESVVRQASCSLSGNDIYGSLTSKRYLVYKDISSIDDERISQFLCDYSERMLNAVEDASGYACRAAVGSAYMEIYDLRNSYMEAAFLLSNFEYLCAGGQNTLLIDRYVFEYLTEYAGLNLWSSRFNTIAEVLKGHDSVLHSTIDLSRHDINISETAAKCGIHRNTLLQRFAKFKEITGLDPASSDRDRMLLRAFALHINRKTTLRVGIVIQPNSILHQGMQKLAEVVERDSGGTMRIDIHTLSVSGNNAMLFETARSGTMDMIVAATGVMNKFTDGLTALIDFPFLFSTNEEAVYVLNSAFLNGIEEPLKNTGIKCLNIWSMGWRYITSRTPVFTPSDLVGKKIRIMSTESIYEYFRSMGALPIHIDYGKVKEALHSGVIDCEENPYHNILGMKFYEEQRYITRLKYYLDTEGLYMCKKTWDALTPAHQELLRRAAKEATEWTFREQHYVINQKAKNSLVHDYKMEILEITEKQKSQWEEYAQPLYRSYPHRAFLENIMEVRDEFRH